MVPVVILSDGYIANGAEPWIIPDINKLKPITITHPGPKKEGDGKFMPYTRNEFLARPWAIPGTQGLMHRVGGLEKQDGSGNVSYDAENHQKMTHIRAQKVANIAKVIPPQEVFGPEQGELLVISWGGTYGACHTLSMKRFKLDAKLLIATCGISTHSHPIWARSSRTTNRYSSPN